MADTFVQYTADGSTSLYTIPFDFLDPSNVVAQLNGVTMLSPGDYSFTGPSSITFNVPPTSGDTVTILRQTSPDSALVSFSNGAVLTASDLNTAFTQCFYRTQELQDALNTYINAGVAKYSATGNNPAVDPQSLLDAAAAAALGTDLASTLLGAISDINTNAASILTNTNQISTLQATLDSLTSGVPGGIGTYLTNETNSRIAGDAALQSTFNLMGAVSNGGATFVLNTANVYVDSLTSMADKFAGIESTLAGNTAAISSEATTRAAADSAQSTLITGLTSTVSGNTAAIATEATTRATADSANASAITSLTTTVAGNTASISAQASSISGLQAQYVVKIDANGNVAGYGLAAGGGSPSQFTVLANKFAVIDPGAPGGTPTVPFSVSGGVVSMQNVVIGGALIENATIDTLQIANNAVTDFYSAQQATVGLTFTYNAIATLCETAAFTPTANGVVRVMAAYYACTTSSACLMQLEVYVKQGGVITYAQPMLANNLPFTGTNLEGTILADLPVLAGSSTVIGLRAIPNAFNSSGSLSAQNSYLYASFIKK